MISLLTTIRPSSPSNYSSTAGKQPSILLFHLEARTHHRRTSRSLVLYHFLTRQPRLLEEGQHWASIGKPLQTWLCTRQRLSADILREYGLDSLTRANLRNLDFRVAAWWARGRVLNWRQQIRRGQLWIYLGRQIVIVWFPSIHFRDHQRDWQSTRKRLRVT